MKWRVTYRDKSARQVNDVFEADCRDTLFKLLQSKGINAIRIAEDDGTKRHSNTRGKPAVGLRIAMLGVVCIAIVVAGVVWFANGKSDKGEPSHSKPRKAKSILVSKPATPHQQANTPKSEPPKRVVTPEERQAGLEAVRNREYDGPVLDMDTYVSPDPGFSNRWERFKAEQAKLPFKYMSENEIAVILDTKPGDMVLDTMPHPNFVRDFLQSLEEPIIPLATDDEKTVQLKKDMVRAKIFLKEAYDRGESITDILREERAQLMKIHGLRENLFRELKEIEKTAKSSQEIDDFVSAANVMLDEYGAKHIKLPYSKERMKLERAEGLIP